MAKEASKESISVAIIRSNHCDLCRMAKEAAKIAIRSNQCEKRAVNTLQEHHVQASTRNF
jgi:hypothetical protein